MRIIVAVFVVICMSFISNPIQCQIAEVDSLALIALYNATDGPNWDTTWDLNSPAEDWFGLNFTGDNVRYINLYENNLTGTIPPEIGDFAELKRLFIYGNNLTGGIPPEIGNCPKLQNIYVNNNNMSGVLPDELGNCTDLIQIYMENNSFSGAIPATIGNCPQLQIWSATNNNLSGEIPEEMGNCSGLQRLFFSGNNFSGALPASLGDIPNMIVFNLSNNDLSGEIPSALGDFPNILEFNVANNNLTGSLPAGLGNSNNLAIANFSNNDFSGCYPDSYNEVCSLGPSGFNGNGYNFNGNSKLPFEGNMQDWCNGNEQIGASCDDGINGNGNDVINGNCSCGPQTSVPLIVSIHIFLEGPYMSNNMSTTLNDSGLLPSGASNTTTDFITIELTDDACNIIATQEVELSSDGFANASFENISASSYYIGVQHRNHVNVKSSTMVTSAPMNDPYDFTSNALSANGPQALKEMSDGNYVLYAGDSNADGVITVLDHNSWRENNGAANVYTDADFDLNGVVESFDFDYWMENRSKVTLTCE